MPTLYKLTDKDGITGAAYNKPLQWAPGVTHEVNRYGRRKRLCGAGVFHAYESPLVAVFMNPRHANYDPARMWRCETEDEIIRDGELKCGVHRLTCVEEMPLPEITTAQRVRAAILCAWEVCDNPKWREWAQRWLSGEDRSQGSAAAEAAAIAAAEAAVWAALAEAEAADWSANVAKWAANAAKWAAMAVDAAEEAAVWSMGRSLPLHSIIEQAIREER